MSICSAQGNLGTRSPHPQGKVAMTGRAFGEPQGRLAGHLEANGDGNPDPDGPIPLQGGPEAGQFEGGDGGGLVRINNICSFITYLT